MAGIESAPVKPRQDRAFWAIESNWRPDPSHLCMTQLRLPGSSHRLAGGRKRRQIVVPHGLSGPASSQSAARDLVLCKPERLCYTLPAREPLFRLFLGSSAVEHSTVNRMVAGSNPARGASYGLYVLRHDRLNLDQRGIRQLGPSSLAVSLLYTRIDGRPAAAGCPQFRRQAVAPARTKR